MKLPSAQALAALLCVLWGLAFVVQRVGLRDSGPLWFSAGRAGLGAAALLPALWIGGRLDARGHLLALALGLTNVAAFFALQAAGLAHVESGPAAAIVYLQPLIVIALAHGVLGERASRRRIVGAVEAHDPEAAKAEIEAVMGRHHGFVLGLYSQTSPDGAAR